MTTLEEVCEELHKRWLAFKEIDKEVKDLKAEAMRFFTKTNTKEYLGDGFIIEVTERTDYHLPTPQDLRKELGKTAEPYISEVVDKDIRDRLPPQLQNKLCPEENVATWITVRGKKHASP